MIQKIKIPFSYPDLKTYAMLEGSYEGIELANSAVIAPTSGSASITGGSLTPTEIFVSDSCSFALRGGQAAVQFQFMNGMNNSGLGSTSHRHHMNNNTLSFPMQTIFAPGSTFSGSLRDGDGTTTLAASINVTGYRMTADTNFAADKVILAIGDSNMRGTTMGGIAFSDVSAVGTQVTPLDHYMFQVRDHFNSRGENCRLVIKAMGSFTTRHIGDWLKRGWLTIPQVNGIVYCLGTNDATTGVTDGQFNAELDRIITWRNTLYPNVPLILLGPTPLNDNTNETRLIALRALLAARANTSANIYFCSLANAFDRTVLTNYTGSDGVHFNIPNHINVANVINSFITTNNIKLVSYYQKY